MSESASDGYGKPRSKESEELQWGFELGMEDPYEERDILR